MKCKQNASRIFKRRRDVNYLIIAIEKTTKHALLFNLLSLNCLPGYLKFLNNYIPVTSYVLDINNEDYNKRDLFIS